MKPERLIQILETRQLYFSSLMEYTSSDPYEGNFPKIVLRKVGEIFQSTRKSMSEHRELIENNTFQKFPDIPIYIKDKLREELEKITNKYEPMEDIFFKIIKSSVVNCWHQNDCESEAMWRLYANKGIAIQTTADNLIQSIDNPIVSFSEVKYIDFNDQNLTLNDCLHQNGLNPLLKRLEFKHEQEARLYFCPTRDYLDKNLEKQSLCVDVDTSRLISKVYISPYISESTAKKIKRKIKKLGVREENIIFSDLLKIDQDQTNLY